jgi:hypothetical protein
MRSSRRKTGTIGVVDRVGLADEEGRALRAVRPRGRPTAARLVMVAVVGAAVSCAVGFGLRALGRSLFDVPNALPTLELSVLLPATIAPVLGNSFGYFMSFMAKPSRNSMKIFLGVAAAFLIPPVVVAATKMPGSANAGSVITTGAVNVFPLLIVPALLLFVPSPAAKKTADQRVTPSRT